MPALLKALESHLIPDVRTVGGQSLRELLATWKGPQPHQTVIRTLDNPVKPAGALVALHGSLFPDGAIIKAAASGMPEAGAIRIPRYLAQAGIRDIVRISDGRMSGTAYGTVVLHGCPEAQRGGPLDLVRDGDLIELDVPAARLDLLVDEAELHRRRDNFTATDTGVPSRGWRRLYADHVTGADVGVTSPLLEIQLHLNTSFILREFGSSTLDHNLSRVSGASNPDRRTITRRPGLGTLRR